MRNGRGRSAYRDQSRIGDFPRPKRTVSKDDAGGDQEEAEYHIVGINKMIILPAVAPEITSYLGVMDKEAELNHLR